MDWDNLRYFLAVARAGQILAASRSLEISQSRLSRHIAELEGSVGVRLFDRTTRGSVLTPHGELLFETAKRLEDELQAGLGRLGAEGQISGKLRIGAPDGFGSSFLAPRLGKLQELYPELHIQIVPISRRFSLSQREADVAVMVGRPEKGRLMVRKLTDYALGLYASTQYLEENGSPATMADLSKHRLIGYVEDMIASDSLAYAQEFLRDWRSHLEIATAMGQLEAVRSGGGIGVLHGFMAEGLEGIMRLFPEKSVWRSYWLVWHHNMNDVPRVRALIDFLYKEIRAEAKRFRLEES